MSIGISFSWATREAPCENILVKRAIFLGNDPDEVIKSFIRNGDNWLTSCDVCELPHKFCTKNKKFCYERMSPKDSLEMMYAANGGCWLTAEQDYVWCWEIWPKCSKEDQKKFIRP